MTGHMLLDATVEGAPVGATMDEGIVHSGQCNGFMMDILPVHLAGLRHFVQRQENERHFRRNRRAGEVLPVEPIRDQWSARFTLTVSPARMRYEHGARTYGALRFCLSPTPSALTFHPA